MPYQRLLEELIHSVDGHGALLLDSQGEVVVEAGARDERHRLIGAYQGIGLTVLRRMAERYGSGSIQYVLCRYASATVILRPLKDGYYLLLSLRENQPIALGLHRSGLTQIRLEREI